MWVTPLGLPVLPEVKKMKAGAEGDGVGGVDCGSRFLQEIFETGAAAVHRSVSDAADWQLGGERAFGEVVVALGVCDEDRGAADFQRVIDLGRLVAIVERRCDQAGPQAAEIVGDERAAIGQERRDAVARLKSKFQIVCGEALRDGVELAPRPAAFVRDEGRLIGLGLQADGEELAERDGAFEWRSGEGHGLLAVGVPLLVRARLYDKLSRVVASGRAQLVAQCDALGRGGHRLVEDEAFRQRGAQLVGAGG